MAAPIIRIKRSAVPGKKPTVDQLPLGELALNTSEGELFVRREREGATGISTDIVSVGAGAAVTNVLYVTQDGDDNNTGKKLGDAKATIAAAVSVATTGTVIRVSAGTYTENNPISLPEQVSIVGDNLREVSVSPQNQGDLFYVRNGNYISQMSFVGSANTGAIFAFDPEGSGEIFQSPYIQNCTNFIPNTIGLKIDGNHAEGNLKSMLLDSYTQYNQGGIGASITNNGYAQLVSMFTICNDIAVYCGSGGGCDLTNSNSSFGNFGLIADGVSEVEYTGIITSPTSQEPGQTTFTISGIGSSRLFDGQVVYFDELYYEVNKITIIDGGSGYSNPPSITIESPSVSWGIDAQATAEIAGGSVTTVNLISSGRGFTTPPTVTVSSPEVGINTAIISVELIEKYYTVTSCTQPSSGICTFTINEPLPYGVSLGTTVPVFRQSRILASSHSFQYIGSGTTINTALPVAGGVSIPENEVDMRGGGLVIYTSTDQSGNFKIGDGVTIDQNTGTIFGNFYTKSILANVTPYILALGG
jgi:hypothetical protein